MKQTSLFIYLCLFLFCACEKGVNEPAPYQESSLLTEICLLPEFSEYCKMARATQSLRQIEEARSIAAPCDSVQTVFGFTNAAVDTFLARFPQYNTMGDMSLDSQEMIVQHHLVLKKRMILDSTVIDFAACDELVSFGTNFLIMADNNKWNFASGNNEIAILSQLTGKFTIAPIQSNVFGNYGAFYRLNSIIGPF